jgi:hypothetical protein
MRLEAVDKNTEDVAPAPVLFLLLALLNCHSRV